MLKSNQINHIDPVDLVLYIILYKLIRLLKHQIIRSLEKIEFERNYDIFYLKEKNLL